MIDSRLPCECCLCAFVEGFFEDAADLLCEHLRLMIQPGSQKGRSAVAGLRPCHPQNDDDYMCNKSAAREGDALCVAGQLQAAQGYTLDRSPMAALEEQPSRIRDATIPPPLAHVHTRLQYAIKSWIG